MLSPVEGTWVGVGWWGDRVCTKAQRQERTWPVLEITNN